MSDDCARLGEPEVSVPVFDVAAVFDVDDYLYFEGASLTPERTEREVELIGIEDTLDAEDVVPGFTYPIARLFSCPWSPPAATCM
jgi:hypothetical protein